MALTDAAIASEIPLSMLAPRFPGLCGLWHTSPPPSLLDGGSFLSSGVSEAAPPLLD